MIILLEKRNKQNFNEWLNNKYIKDDIIKILECTHDKYENILNKYKEDTEILL